MLVRRIYVTKVLLAGLLTASMASFSYAQRPGRFAGPGGPGGPGRIAGLAPRIARELGLTDAQKEQMKSYLQDARSQMQLLRNDTTLTPEQRRTQVQQIRETTQAKLKAVLTPTQQAKADELRAQARQKMEERRTLVADRRLEHMTSQLGLSASQSSAIKSLTEQARNQAKAIRENSALTQEQKMQQLQALRTDTRNQITTNLTPDQKTKLDQLRQQAVSRFEHRRRGGAGFRGPRQGGAPMGLSL